MSGTYYTFTPLEPFELARVAEVNSRFAQAATAFDSLPAPLLISQQRMTYAGLAGGTGNALTVTLPMTAASYTAGLLVTLKVAHDNTGPATINVDGLGAVQIVRPDAAALEAADLLTGAVVDLRYDGTAFRLMGGINPSAVNASTLVAQGAATAAASSATAAAASAATASGAQAAVAANATAAGTSATNAATSATAAAASATAAGTSASGASTSASGAATSATAAAASATAAAGSATTANTKAGTATTKAAEAAASASDAAAQAGAAADEATAAASSAAAAASSAGSIDGSIYLQKSDNLAALNNKATARTNLGVAIGTDVQAFNAKLAALAGVTGAANKVPYFTGASAMSVADLTAFAITLLAAGDAAAARGVIGLAIGSNVQAWDADLDALAGLTSAANKLPYFSGVGSAAVADFTAFARTLLDDTSQAAMQTTLAVKPGTDVQPFHANLSNLAALTISAGNAGKYVRIDPTGAQFELVAASGGWTQIGSTQTVSTPVASVTLSLGSGFTEWQVVASGWSHNGGASTPLAFIVGGTAYGSAPDSIAAAGTANNFARFWTPAGLLTGLYGEWVGTAAPTRIAYGGTNPASVTVAPASSSSLDAGSFAIYGR